MPAGPPPASPPAVPETAESVLRTKLASKARHSKQNKALLMLVRSEKKKLSEENRRLREENAELRSRLERFQGPRDVQTPITPKHAILRAGYFNVHHNDVLRLTPMLVAAYETEMGKAAIHREGMTVCFPIDDRDAVISIVERLAPTHLPGYLKKCN